MTSDRGSVRLSRRRALTVGSAATATVLAATGLPGSGQSHEATETAGESTRGPFERAHDVGITGEGVHVGVLDTTGFDPGRQSLDGSIEALRGFDDADVVVDRTSHGTASAASVARLAPDARLSLAAFSRPAGFEAAVDWFGRLGVDAVLAPVAAHGAVSSERSRVARAAAAAVESGVTFVAPTGNAARGHWRGPYGALPPGESESHRLRVRSLSGGTPTGRLVAWLVADSAPDAPFNLALLRETGTGDGRNLVALSQSVPGRAAERLVADLTPDEYVLGVRRTDGDAPEVSRTTVEVVTPTHRLVPARPAGSIAAPAFAPGVLAVGTAVDGVSPYSGRGPTPDGRIGVDVVAPPRPWVGAGPPGSSGAAARVAGAVALVSSVAPDASPEDVVGIVRASAGDMGRNGPDLTSGWGRLAPFAAVQRARSR